MSHIGLIQLIDLLVGIDADPQSLARLMWAVEAWDDDSQLRSYYVDKALKHYDAAMAKAVLGVVDDFVEEVKQAARNQRVRLCRKKYMAAPKRHSVFLTPLSQSSMSGWPRS